ncbi:MAG: transposase, partial [Eubacterium sp.]
KDLSKRRYKIEAKNSELKNQHGYRRAESSGIQAMEIQGATAIFCVNLLRIVRLMEK